MRPRRGRWPCSVPSRLARWWYGSSAGPPFSCPVPLARAPRTNPTEGNSGREQCLPSGGDSAHVIEQAAGREYGRQTSQVQRGDRLVIVGEHADVGTVGGFMRIR